MMRFFLAFVFVCLTATPALAKPTLAIVDLTNHTGDASLDPAGPGVAGLLVSRFMATDAVQVVERQDLERVLAELNLSQSGAVDEASALQAGRLLGARYMVFGDIFSVHLPTLSVSLRVVDTQDGSVVAAKDVVGEIGDRGEKFFVLVDQLANEIIRALDLQLSPSDRIELSQVEVRELEGVLAYGRSLHVAPGEQPKALWRDKTRDMQSEPYRLMWVVHNNEGTSFPTIAFARTVGDEPTALRLERERDAANARIKRGGHIALGSLGAGALVALMAPLTATSDGGVPMGPIVLGSAIGLGGLGFGVALGSGNGRLRLELAHPGYVYSLDQADALIDAHNTGL